MKIKKSIVFFTLILLFAASCLITAIHKTVKVYKDGSKAYLAIVIDDFGYGGEGTEEILNLPIKLTAAVMPFSEYSAEDTEKAGEAGKEVIIHMPMEPLEMHPLWLGEKAIRVGMTPEEIEMLVYEALANVDTATGLNNHMGSRIMEDEEALTVIIKTADSLGLVFLDSRTTLNSKAPEVCKKLGLTCLERDVFIDGTQDVEIIKDNLRKAGDLALQKGRSIAIGHVGPEGGSVTAEAIREVAPELMAKGIEFVTVSEYAEMLKSARYGIFTGFFR